VPTNAIATPPAAFKKLRRRRRAASSCFAMSSPREVERILASKEDNPIVLRTAGNPGKICNPGATQTLARGLPSDPLGQTRTTTRRIAHDSAASCETISSQSRWYKGESSFTKCDLSGVAYNSTVKAQMKALPVLHRRCSGVESAAGKSAEAFHDLRPLCNENFDAAGPSRV
jgi:hypothetical protein